MSTPRESITGIVLPNNLTMVAGGQNCEPATVGGQNGFLCTSLQTAELYNESTQAFTLAGSGSGNQMTVARSGPTVTLISGSGTALDGQVLIAGGASGASFLSIVAPSSPPIQTALNTAELYNPSTDAFTAIASTIPLPTNCPGASSVISSTSESGNTVTVTMSSANPSGLTVGKGVAIKSVSVAGYNGNFTVASIPSGTTFTYTDSTSGLAAGSSGSAAALTTQCGLVDHGAALIPNDGGKVLLAGGDLYMFLGESSNSAFIFDPTTRTFGATGSMISPRELFPLIALDPAVVHGSLGGQVVAFGGIDANSNVCTTTASPAVVTTLNVAEVFNPSTGSWTAASNTMLTKRTTIATLFEVGSLAGEVILPGGVDVEAGTFPSTCAAITQIKQGATPLTDLYDPGTGAEGTFSATGSLNQAREGQGQGIIGAGIDATDLLVAGGACTTATPSLQSVTIGTSQAATTCSNTGGSGSNSAENDYSELYSQSTRTWTVGPAPAGGTGCTAGSAGCYTPTNAPAFAVLP